MGLGPPPLFISMSTLQLPFHKPDVPHGDMAAPLQAFGHAALSFWDTAPFCSPLCTCTLCLVSSYWSFTPLLKMPLFCAPSLYPQKE